MGKGKVHTRIKRKIVRIGGRNRMPRPKTFKTEELAKTWASKQGLKDFSLVNLRSPESKEKKIRVVVKG